MKTNTYQLVFVRGLLWQLGLALGGAYINLGPLQDRSFWYLSSSLGLIHSKSISSQCKSIWAQRLAKPKPSQIHPRPGPLGTWTQFWVESMPSWICFGANPHGTWIQHLVDFMPSEFASSSFSLEGFNINFLCKEQTLWFIYCPISLYTFYVNRLQRPHEK